MGIVDHGPYGLLDRCRPNPRGIAAVNDPATFAALSAAEQAALLAWIRLVMVPARRLARLSSYGLKHEFEADGFYVTNGAFKGGMLAAGHRYRPGKSFAPNWRFYVKPARTVRSREDGRRFGLWEITPAERAEYDRLRMLCE